MYQARIPKHFPLPHSARSALGVLERSPEQMSGADAAITLLPRWKPWQGMFREDRAMVNIEIYWQRQLLILKYRHIPPSPSLSLSTFLSDCPFGLVYCFSSPYIIYMSHMTSFPSVMLGSVSLLPLYPFNVPHSCCAFSCLFLLFLISNLVDYVAFFCCFWSYDLYSADFHYLLFVISFCLYIMNALRPCKIMIPSTYLC